MNWIIKAFNTPYMEMTALQGLTTVFITACVVIGIYILIVKLFDK